MKFNSSEFLLFAIVFFILWPLLRKKDNVRWGFITLASFIFYGWWDWRFLFLIVGSGLIDYFCGLGIELHQKHKRSFLILSLIGNLGSLSVFKYSSFFARVLEDVLGTFGMKIDLIGSIPEFALILPVGISFYTFQSLSYTIDIYRGRLTPTRNILHFFSYLSMFPQLVAGPIVRAKDFLEQLRTYKVPDWNQKWNAIKLIVYGLFQKMVIADNLSFFIDSAFEGKTAYDGSLYWWLVMVAFSFQIYADFSGYSLIARGLAKYMGYHFKMNFDHPYISRSMKEFWTRWHISLSSWFRDYVYIPLGGSRKGVSRGLLIMAVTMLLSGLWHGANYTFVFWALIHVVWLAIERLTKWNKKLINFPLVLTFIVFNQALIAWIYFRAENLQQGNQVLINIFSFKPSNIDFLYYYLDSVFFLGLAILIETGIFFRKYKPSVSLFYKRSNLDIVFVSLCILCILFFKGEGQQFIYFQF